MLGLIGLPFRVGRRVAETALELSVEVARRAAAVVLTERERPESPDSVRVRVSVEDDVLADEAPVVLPVPDLGPAQEFARDPEPEPIHVSEEPVLVEEFAEPGAEDGAGAQVHVEEPWVGYDAMRVPDIARELASAEPTVAAAVKLYEVNGRGRRGVIAAADRRLRA